LFSLPYTTATALVHGAVKLEHMLDQSALSNPVVRAVAERISVDIDAELEAKYGRVIGPSIVEVTLKDGRKLSQRVDLCKGHPKNPMSIDDCEEKFWTCVPYAAKPLDRGRAEDVVRQVRDFENLDDVAAIVRLLS
jgi:2-methylcitrate dehydratase PrpD